MAEPIGIASGILALAGFTLESSISLYRLVKSFKCNQEIVHELLLELEALGRVLQSLQQTVANDAASLAGIEKPLSSCCKACEDFKALIVKCASHSEGTWPIVRDWTKLKIKRGDIAEFKEKLARYKSTLSIALCGATLLTTTATAKDLEVFKERITETILGLQKHIQKFEDRRQTDAVPGASVSDEDAAEREWIQGEKESAKECLAFCARLSEHVDEARRKLLDDVSAAPEVHPLKVTTLRDFMAKQVTADQFEDIGVLLMRLASKVEKRVLEFDNKLKTLGGGVVNEKEDQEGIKECLSFCSKVFDQVEQAQTHLFEDVSAAEHARQVIVTTTQGDYISAKRVTAGIGTMQILGQIPDGTLHQISRDCTIALRATREKAVEQQSETCREFGGQYGPGRKL